MTCELVRKGRQEPRDSTWVTDKSVNRTPETGRAPGVEGPYTEALATIGTVAVPDARLKERMPDAWLQSLKLHDDKVAALAWWDPGQGHNSGDRSREAGP